MRQRLGLVVLAVSAMIVLAFVVPLGMLVRDQARDRALARAERDAQAVASGFAVALSLASAQSEAADLAHLVVASSATAVDISIYLPDGTVAGIQASASANIERARLGVAFTAEIDEGAEVLIPVSSVLGTSVVRAFLPTSEIREGVATAWTILATLGVVLLVVGVLVADRLGRSIVTPVRALASSAHRFAEGDLDARVHPSGPPEVAELARSFNYLAERLDDLLAAERESAADLSHRLRTPLTALRLQAGNIDSEAAASLMADIDKLEHEVNRVIEEARRPTLSTGPKSTDLAAVVAHRAEFWKVLAESQGRAMRLAIPPSPVVVAVSEADLAAAVDVLLENVFAHTPPGTAFDLRVATAANVPVLTVSDEGPGLAGRDVLQRGASGSGSTGLGLDIVRRVAERTGGRILVSSKRDRGAVVEVHFGTRT